MSLETLQAIKIICSCGSDHYLSRILIINHLLPLTIGYSELVDECDGNEDKADERAFADILEGLASIRNSINDFLKSNLYLD